MQCKLTWCDVDDGSGAVEVARAAGPVLALVVAVDRVGGVRDHGVGFVARRPRLDGAAVGAVGAGVVQRRQQPRVAGSLLRHTPAPVGVTGACRGRNTVRRSRTISEMIGDHI